jgi:hypothetical protein
VGRGARVGDDGGAGAPRERAGGAGVVEVDVADEDVRQAAELEAGLGDGRLEARQRAAGPGVDEREGAAAEVEQVAGDRLGDAGVVEVEGVDHDLSSLVEGTAVFRAASRSSASGWSSPTRPWRRPARAT